LTADDDKGGRGNGMAGGIVATADNSGLKEWLLLVLLVVADKVAAAEW
jgi:hypothetical protein